MDQQPSNSIAVLVDANPTLVLIDEKKFEDFYEHVKAEASSMKVDLTTEKGRKAIASMAHKIARTKTAIDDAGKKLNEEARSKINAVDEARRKIRDRFDMLKEEVRRPLTEWEKAEEDRLTRVQQFFDRMDSYCRVYIEDTTASLSDRIQSLELVQPDENLFKERHAEAVTARDYAIQTLLDAHQRIEKEEADRAELERLRREQAEREAQEAQRRADEQRRQQEQEAAKREEEERQQAAEREKAEQERIEREARERADAEAKARIEAAERAAREAEAEAARKIEAERRAREAEKAEQERVAAATRAAEQARQADREHRAKIMGEAKAALIELGLDEARAKEVVLAVAAGNIPHIHIKF